MKRYRADVACAKCGHGGVPETRWVERNVYAGKPEHMERLCRRCGYMWIEAPLDAPDATPPSDGPPPT